MKNLVYKIWDLDRTLFRVLFRLKWQPLTAVMRAFTTVGTAGLLWGALAAGAFLFTGLRPSHLVVPWVAVALSWTLAEGAKYLFNRARPFIDDTEVAPLIKTPSSSSFPSGHSATAAAGALTLSAVYPSFTPALVLSGLGWKSSATAPRAEGVFDANLMRLIPEVEEHTEGLRER